MYAVAYVGPVTGARWCCRKGGLPRFPQWRFFAFGLTFRGKFEPVFMNQWQEAMHGGWVFGLVVKK